MIILGLDISTTVTGYSLINTDLSQSNCIVEFDGIHLSKKKSLYDKADLIKKEFLSLSKNYKIDLIFAEESLQSFRRGLSSAKTLSTLSRFNGIVSWLCVETFEIEPEMIAASSARKKVGVKIQKGEKAKEKSFHFVLANEPSFVVEYTKNGNPRPGSMDKSDSWIIAKAGLLICNQKS